MSSLEAQPQISHLSCTRLHVHFLASAGTFSTSIMSKMNNRSGAGAVLTDSWCLSVITALSVFGQTLAPLPAIVLIWIPRGRDSLSVAVCSWCLPQRLQKPPASIATSDDSHLANKSIMRKATASDMPTSPVIPDIEMRGQRRVSLLGHGNQVNLVISKLSGSNILLKLLSLLNLVWNDKRSGGPWCWCHPESGTVHWF